MKRLIAAVIAAILALSLFPVLCGAAGTRTVAYDQEEYDKLIAFFDIVDENGVRNGDKVAPDFPPEDPDDWSVFVTPYYDQGVYWSDDGHEAHVTRFDMSSFDFVGELDLSDFEWLEDVYCFDNRLTGVDVSGSEELDTLVCSMNNITHLELEDTPALGSLECEENKLASIDLSGCPGLWRLLCGENELTSIDVSPCPGLTTFLFGDNQVSEIDVSCCPDLESLTCSNNLLTELDISHNRQLQELEVDGNPLTSIDLTRAPYLNWFTCCDTGIEELDLSHNHWLEGFDCRGNRLTEVDLTAAEMLFLDEVRADGNGYIGCFDNGLATYVSAVPAEGSRFIGWYSESGRLLSSEPDFGGICEIDDNDEISGPNPIEETGEKVWIARFDGGSEPAEPDPTEPDPTEPEPTEPASPEPTEVTDPGAPQSGSASLVWLGAAAALAGAGIVIFASSKRESAE